MINNSLIYLIVRLGNGLLAIATLAIFSRLLSPSDYGFYALVMSAGAVLSSVLFQWLEFAVARYYPSYLNNHQKIMTTVNRGFWVATLATSIFCMAAFFIHKILKIEPFSIAILFFLIVGLGLYTLTLQIVNSQNLPILYGILSWSKSAITLMGAIIFIYFGMTKYAAPLAFIAGLILAVLLVKWKNKIGFPLLNFGGHISVDMFRYGLPLSLNIIASSIIDIADRIMISGLLGFANVASYALAFDFVQFSIGPFMNIFILTTFPSIVRMFDENDQVRTDKNLKILGANLLIFGLPLVFTLLALGKDITGYIFDIKYQQEVVSLMPLLAIAIYIGVFKSYFLDLVFQLHHATKYQLYIAILMAIVNIVLNLIFLPIYGVIAAAWSILVTFSVGAVASWLIGRKIYILPNLNVIFFKSILSSAIIFFIMDLMTALNSFFWIMLKLMLIILIYLALMFAFDMLNSRNLIRGFFLRIKVVWKK